jgi:hypothetical protein
MIVIGLGLALRVLQRIERALLMPPMPRTSRAAEHATPALGLTVPAEPAHITIPHRSAAEEAKIDAVEPPTESKNTHKGAAKSFERSDFARLKFPTTVRPTFASSDDEEVTLSKPSLRVDPAIDEVNKSRAARQRNGSVAGKATPRLEVPHLQVPRLDTAVRSSSPPERIRERANASPNPFWTKVRRPAESLEAPPPVELEPQAAPMDTPPPEPDEAAAPVSVLKSGVVDGMAYTLFSDGSIEAQLPQGMLRFGSITELRNHIEQSPPDAAMS